LWLICRLAFTKGKTKLLIRGTQDAEWIFCPMIKSIKKDKLPIQRCKKCTQFIRIEQNSLIQMRVAKRSLMPKRADGLHFRKPPVNRWVGFKRPTVTAPPPPMLSFRGEKQPIFDVFEEEEYVVVSAELPGMEAKDVNMVADETTVTIMAKNVSKTYWQKIKLPKPVTKGTVKFFYKNNVLQARLKKTIKN
jgi:HSP20 family molecular chaperone IbpA